MAFLFKSKKNQERAMQGRDGPSMHSSSAAAATAPIQNPATRVAREERVARSTPTGSVTSIDNESNPSPGDAEKYAVRRTHETQLSQQMAPQSGDTNQTRNGPPPNPNSSLYPWSQRKLAFTTSIPSPFPRYGAAVNTIASKEGDIYVMGGLINSSTVKGDLWIIEAGNGMACYPLATHAEGPGPRVGHASLLVGNAFIVYGGDTKIDETDVLDETLYLLNTSTRQWSRALPAGPRPSGRYGHSLNIVGSKIYIFGGQVEGYFLNDLAAFDLNQLQVPNNRWEVLNENVDHSNPAIASNPAQGKVPPARTNHTMITYNDKMYLFGGTNGFTWFNDVWCYDPAVNKWTMLDCIGYIPGPREGHAAALVDDVMYVLGGRTEDGHDLGDLAAFRIASRRWYTFQNMGPSPSARSGHSMTAVGKTIVVVGGEPSSATTPVNDLSLAFCLDTTKIRYPTDAQIQSNTQKMQQTRRPSTSEGPSSQTQMGMGRPPPSRDGAQGPSQGPLDQRRMMNGRDPNNGQQISPTMRGPNGSQSNGPQSAAAPPTSGSRLPRVTGPGPPAGPPPAGQPPRPATSGGMSSTQNHNTSMNVNVNANTNTSTNGRPRTTSVADRNDRDGSNIASPKISSQPQSPILGALGRDEAGMGNLRALGSNTPTSNMSNQQPSNRGPAARSESAAANPEITGSKTRTTRQTRGQSSVDSNIETSAKISTSRPSSPPPPGSAGTSGARQANPIARKGSGRNSQTVVLLKELDSARNRNAWYASELELARKAGYVPNNALSPTIESRAESFNDEDRPLVEALLAMKQEVANVQSSIDKQAILASKQIAEAERQRDAAISEAVYAKARLAAHGGSAASTPQLDGARDIDQNDRAMGASRKLAASLNLQKEIQSQLERTTNELEAEKRARQLAEETTTAAQKRMTDLETYKQQTSLEMERLRAELHAALQEAREMTTANAETAAALEILQVKNQDLESKYRDMGGEGSTKAPVLDSLQKALAASLEVRTHLEQKVEGERTAKESVESKLAKLKAEHESHTAELVAVSQRLRDAEELAERHANEANAHRQAVLSGLDKLTAMDSQSKQVDAERLTALQGQLTTANQLVKKYQKEADTAADKLRSAEERIAGLEAYQEQSSREGVTIRRQLQAALKDTQTLQAQNSDLKHQLANQQLEANAITVQHNTLKEILTERGISPTGLTRVRGLSSRTASPAFGDLEQRLVEAKASHEETKQQYEAQAQQAEAAYRERVSQLENDYQSAVHYVKGTEKMLKRMKEELTKLKGENARLKSESLEREEQSSRAAHSRNVSVDWENERATLVNKIEIMEEQVKSSSDDMEQQLSQVRKDVETAQKERDEAAKSGNETAERLQTREKELDQMHQEYLLLEKRAQDAEHKVTLLLDQVESSVTTYRRRSRQVLHLDAGNATAANGSTAGHQRQDSSEAESLYGGLGDARNSAALDNLADELEHLRSKWEATSENYRMSHNFDFEGVSSKKDDNTGLSESLADWRKRLDVEEQEGSVSGRT